MNEIKVTAKREALLIFTIQNPGDLMEALDGVSFTWDITSGVEGEAAMIVSFLRELKRLIRVN